MRFKAESVFGVVVTLLLFVGTAHADLAEVDLSTPGDGLITRDSDTGLDWLDLTETTNVSYLAIRAGAGGWYGDGWVHATGAQIATLFLNSAPGATLNQFLPGANFTGAVKIIDLLGATIVHPRYPLARGFSDTPPHAGGNADLHYAQADLVGGFGLLRSPFGGTNSTIGFPDSGHFLVRATPTTAPIPEPSTLALFGAAIGLVWWRRRRRAA